MASDRATSELRKFGLVMAAAIAVVFGLALPWLFARPWPAWPFVLAAVFVAFGLVAPRALGPVQRLWMKLGQALGWFNSRLVLSLVFVVVVVPLGLVMRLAGKDPVSRRRDPNAASYRVASAASDDPQSMEKPF
ncbi:MAG: hypothetical protein IT522_02795 [Burkholderiales bacterium]|nr:hypothetical protein [Burkholderiales bacterium]